MTTEIDSQKAELFYAIIDGQATEEEKKHFFSLCENCQKTLSRFEQEKEVIGFIRQNLQRTPMPENFEDRIRQNISSLFV